MTTMVSIGADVAGTSSMEPPAKRCASAVNGSMPMPAVAPSAAAPRRRSRRVSLIVMRRAYHETRRLGETELLDRHAPGPPATAGVARRFDRGERTLDHADATRK